MKQPIRQTSSQPCSSCSSVEAADFIHELAAELPLTTYMDSLQRDGIIEYIRETVEGETKATDTARLPV